MRLARLIKQYSQFIQFPIKLWSARKEPKSIVDDAATAKKQEEADKVAKEKGEEAADKVCDVCSLPAPPGAAEECGCAVCCETAHHECSTTVLLLL